MPASRSRHPAKKRPARRAGKKYWSSSVTRNSDALDLESDVFKKRDPSDIASSLKRSAEHSRRRKASPFKSAMSMLTFYINRAGKNLSASRRRTLDHAKDDYEKPSGKADEPVRSDAVKFSSPKEIARAYHNRECSEGRRGRPQGGG